MRMQTRSPLAIGVALALALALALAMPSLLAINATADAQERPQSADPSQQSADLSRQSGDVSRQAVVTPHGRSMRDRIGLRFTSMDLNGDGRVDEDEYAAYPMGDITVRAPERRADFKAADQDRDGQMTQAEFDAMVVEMLKQRGDR